MTVTSPPTLRDALYAIAQRRLPHIVVAKCSLPEIVNALAVEAFLSRWVEGPDTRTIRRALLCLRVDGGIAATEPAE